MIRSFLMLGLIPLVLAGSARGQVAPPQPGPVADARHYDLTVDLDPERSFLVGTLTVDLTIVEDTLAIPFNFHKQLTIIEVRDSEGTRLSLRTDDFTQDRIRVQAPDLMRQGTSVSWTFEFEGMLEQEQYAFLDVPSTQKAVIGPEGAHLFSEGHWFPSHRLVVDGATFDIRMTVPLGFSVVGPGTLAEIETVGIQEVFHWSSSEPITSTPVLVARYYRQSFDEKKLPLTFYVTGDFEGDLEPWSEAVDRIVDFFAARLDGMPVDSLTVAEVGDLVLTSPGSRGLLLLEQEFISDSDVPEFELARRLALQWWGYSLRVSEPTDAWLSDGFATFWALQYLKEIRPDDFEPELNRLAVQAMKYQETAPIISGYNLVIGSPKYESIVAAKGAWVLHMLGELIGRETLDQAISDFYLNHRDSSARISDFVERVNQTTGEDYGWFFLQWIESVGVPEFRVDYTIYRIRDGGYRIRGQVEQNLELFRMPMDLLIETKTTPETKEILVSGKNTSFDIVTKTYPTRIEIDPEGDVLMDSDRMRVAVTIALGDEYRTAGEYVSALQEYERAVDMNPRSSLAHFRLGQTFFDQHSYSNAANSMRDSLNGDLRPPWVETWAHIYMGKVYDILGQRQRAIAEYQKAINTRIDYNGAQAEARKYQEEPFTKPSSVLG